MGRLELPVGRLPTGSQLSVPLAVLHGKSDGPCVWFSAAVHGDELNGIPIVRQLVRVIDARSLVGTVMVVPVVNAFGLINASRYLPDRRDLNRSFPGSARGSLASQLAHLFMTEVVQRCEFGVDLHSGSGGRTNLPQIRCDLEDETTRKAAICFGAPLTLHSSLRDGSLREAARKLGCRVLVYETGEAGRFDPWGITLGVRGCMRVLSSLGMIPEPAPAGSSDPASVVAWKSAWVRTRRSGFCEMKVRLGEQVEPGQTLAIVYDALALHETRIVAPDPGIVIGHQAEALVNRGDALVHVARVADAT